MKYLNMFLTLLGLLSAANISIAQESRYSVVYDFHVHDTEVLKEGKVQIQVFKEDINSFGGKNVNYIDLDLTGSVTRVTVPIPKRINYLHLEPIFMGQQGSESLIDLNVGNNLFIVEDKDTIELHLYPKKYSPVLFKGTHAKRYTLQFELAKQVKINDSVYIQSRDCSDKRQYSDAFKVLSNWADSIINIISDRLNKADINPDIKSLLWYDNVSRVYNTQRSIVGGNTLTISYDIERQKAVLTEIPNIVKITKDFDPEVAAKSLRWGDMLLQKEWLQFALEKHPDRVDVVKNNDFGFINYLAERYTGVLRDKLFYLALSRQWDVYGLKTIALPILNTNIYATAFKNLLSRMEGATMFDVELFNSEGKVVRFSDYKGKVIIVDLWYTGCLPCKVLGKELEAMHKEMEHMDDVIFISLSFDRNKDLWLKSLAEGEYTYDGAINLWIGEEAMKHPITEHYSIKGYPQLMIVDKEGKLAIRSAIKPYRIKPDSWDGFKGLVESYR